LTIGANAVVLAQSGVPSSLAGEKHILVILQKMLLSREENWYG
jgi:hypothetical protein